MRPFLRVLGLRTLRDGVNGVRADGVTSSDGTSSGRKRSAPVFPLQSRQLEVEAVVDVDVEFLGRDVGHAHAEELERWQVVLCQRVDEVVQDEPTNPRLLADNPCREVLRLGHLSVDRHVLPHSREEMRRVVPAPVGQDGVGGMCVCVCVRHACVRVADAYVADARWLSVPYAWLTITPSPGNEMKRVSVVCSSPSCKEWLVVTTQKR